MTRTEIIEALQAATPGDKILLLSLLNYDQIPVTDDLIDSDVPAWKNVNDLIDGISISSIIPIWASGSYVEYAAVRMQIDGVWYLFISQVNNNTTEPSLTPALPPWAVGSNQYAGNWTSLYPYLLNDVVQQSGRLYLSLVAANTGNDPASSPDFWKDLGVNQGAYNPALPDGYGDDDAVFYDGYSYSSNISSNVFLPTDPGTNAWDLIGDNPTLEPNKPKEITVADNTQLDGDADSGWYYTIPFASYSAYGNYPDIRIYRDSAARINLDYTNTLSGDITLPLPDVDDDGKTLYPYLIIITK